MYVETMRSWLRDLLRNPGIPICMSLLFIVSALPLVTWGWAWGLIIRYGRYHIEGRKVSIGWMLKDYGRSAGRRALLMGVADILFAAAAVLAFITLCSAGKPLMLRAANALFLWIDLLYLASGLYRYPLIEYRNLSLQTALREGFLVSMVRMKDTALLSLAGTGFFLVSLLAGITLPAFFPGGLALLSSQGYLQIEKIEQQKKS